MSDLQLLNKITIQKGDYKVMNYLKLMGIFVFFTSLSSKADEWPMYGRDLHHSFANTASLITASNVASMVPAWSFTPGDVVTATPTVVNGVVYVGSWDGYFYALNKNTGSLLWRFQVDCDNAIAPIPPQCLAPGETSPPIYGSDGGLITASAIVQDGTVYFSGGKTMYALRATDGHLLWKKVFCGNPEAVNCKNDNADSTRIFSSPMIYNNRLFIAQTPDGQTGYRGAIVALNKNDGSLIWRFEVDPKLDSTGHVIGVYNRGCGSVWGSGAIDEVNNLIAFGTGDCQNDATPPYHEAVLALNMTNGKVKWAYRPRTTDVCDFDFGASANILTINGKNYVGIGGKDGTYYVLKSDTTNPAGSLLWSTRVVFGGDVGGFIGSTAFDGHNIYGGTAYGDSSQCNPSDPTDVVPQDPSFHALSISSGAIAWQQTFNYTFAPSSVGNGITLNGWVGFPDYGISPSLRVYDSTTGDMVAEFTMPGMVNSGVAITSNMLFLGTGSLFDSTGSTIQAWKLPSDQCH